MKNYEQKRAIHALKMAQKARKGSRYEGAGGSGSIVKKVPALIVAHGLLGTLAFALSDDNKVAYRYVLEDAADYLAQEGFIDPACMHRVGLSDSTCTTKGEKLMEYLSGKCSAKQLRLITDEIMAYLSYLRRF